MPGVTFFDLIEKPEKYLQKFNFEKLFCVHGFGKTAEPFFYKICTNAERILLPKEYGVNQLKIQARKWKIQNPFLKMHVFLPLLNLFVYMGDIGGNFHYGTHNGQIGIHGVTNEVAQSYVPLKVNLYDTTWHLTS